MIIKINLISSISQLNENHAVIRQLNLIYTESINKSYKSKYS